MGKIKLALSKHFIVFLFISEPVEIPNKKGIKDSSLDPSLYYIALVLYYAVRSQLLEEK
jgi:hypothetical protein